MSFTAAFWYAGCMAFDLNSSACAGFIYGLGIADQFIRNGAVKTALVIGSEKCQGFKLADRTTCVLFGDGAGAVVLGARKTPGILSTHLHADGTHKDVLSLGLALVSLRLSKKNSMSNVRNPLFKLAVNILGICLTKHCLRIN